MSFIDWPDVLALEFPEDIKSWDFEFCPLALAGDGGMGSGGKVFFFFFGDRGRISESTVTRLCVWIVIVWIWPLKKKINDKINLIVNRYNIQKLKIIKKNLIINTILKFQVLILKTV